MTISRRTLFKGFLIGSAAVPLSGCGTLLYPERRGQTGGKIDPGVAVLNGVGLLLFVIPGLIAFAVDFSTGAIYLPGTRAELEEGKSDLKVVSFDEQLNDEEMDRLWAAHYDQERPFRNAELTSRPISRLSELEGEARYALAMAPRAS
ncbi:MAG: hypothetical protein AAGA69_05800 [Pseudomonadota bacterium]